MNPIDNLNYWEHFKKAKDLALIYPPEHPQRVELQEVMETLLNEKQTGPPKQNRVVNSGNPDVDPR